MVRLLFSLILFMYFFIVSSEDSFAAISFTISNPVVTPEGEVEVEATISGLISSSCSTGGCYIQGRFQSSEGYFGYTQNNSGEFVDYFGNSGSADEIKTKLFNFTPVGGAWNGRLRVKNNFQSSCYFGPGEYPLSFRRFSGNSTTPTSVESNVLVINLTQTISDPTPNPSQTTSPTPSPTVFALKTPTPTPESTKAPTPNSTKLPTPKSTPDVLSIETSYPIEILKSEDPTPTPDVVLEQPESARKFPALAVVLISTGIVLIGVAGYIAFKYNDSQCIKN